MVASSGQIRLKDIRKMLKRCAPGYSWVEKGHHIHVHLGAKVFRNLPKGDHGKKTEIQRPWVRKLARYLEIEECAGREIPGLFPGATHTTQ